MEEAGFMSHMATNHQGAIKTLWLHFWGAVKAHIFIHIVKPDQQLAKSCAYIPSDALHNRSVAADTSNHLKQFYFSVLHSFPTFNLSDYWWCILAASVIKW